MKEKNINTLSKKSYQLSSHFYILLVIGYAGIDYLGKHCKKHFSFQLLACVWDLVLVILSIVLNMGGFRLGNAPPHMKNRLQTTMKERWQR